MFPSIILYSVILICPLLLLYNTPNVCGCTEPLLLTPYLQQGEITTARELSLVVDEEGVIPRSHAGYITVDEDVGNHLFFWFFPTLNSNSLAPLLIWLNGGPGETSMTGLLYENGPIQLGKSNSGKTIYTRRNNSWVNKFSMLYIDNPVGTGYSYSDNLDKGHRSTQDGITGDLFEFIKQFYQIFPEFLLRDLYIGGQSYAGKYVPALAYKVHQDIPTSESQIPLKGIYLCGPVIDAEVQFLKAFDMFYTLGYITKTELNEYKRNFTETLPPFKIQNGNDMRPLWYWNVKDNLNTDERIPDEEINTVMTSDKLQSLLHAGNRSFEPYNSRVFFSVVKDNFFVSSKSELLELMNNYKVLIYNGDLDGVISALGLEAVLQSLQWSSQSAYNTTRRRTVWTDELRTIKGFYTHVGNFCRVVIRASGHRTAFDQPEKSLEVMDHFVTKGCLR